MVHGSTYIGRYSPTVLCNYIPLTMVLVCVHGERCLDSQNGVHGGDHAAADWVWAIWSPPLPLVPFVPFELLGRAPCYQMPLKLPKKTSRTPRVKGLAVQKAGARETRPSTLYMPVSPLAIVETQILIAQHYIHSSLYYVPYNAQHLGHTQCANCRTTSLLLKSQ